MEKITVNARKIMTLVTQVFTLGLLHDVIVLDVCGGGRSSVTSIVLLLLYLVVDFNTVD